MEQDALSGDAKSNLLFVDDELNILSALKRLFRPTGHKVMTASSGQAALEILENNEIDLIISDMRMPEMDGAELLSRVAKQWPEIVRILLTGFADMESTIRAVNEGHIYRYVSKPWEDNDIKLTVEQALERKQLKAERDRLLDITKKQNDELKDLNANLENKVKERTKELSHAHDTLRKSYFSSIKTFSNLIEMREGTVSGHSKRVAENAQKVAVKLGLEKDDVQQIFFAALLHDIGKISLPDYLINKPFSSLTEDEKKQVTKHSALGEALLMGFEPLNDAAKIIRSHHEYFDGSGYPDKLKGDDIPIGAKILALVNEYDALQQGTLVSKNLSKQEAQDYILRNRGHLFDPSVVDAFVTAQTDKPQKPKKSNLPATEISAENLMPGMVLAHDLITKGGILVLSEGYILDEKLIERIRKFAQSTDENLEIKVVPGRGKVLKSQTSTSN